MQWKEADQKVGQLQEEQQLRRPLRPGERVGRRAVLLEQQRKKEVQDEGAVGALVKVVYAESWTTRAGAAMSSGYGKQVRKRKLCHIWDLGRR